MASNNYKGNSNNNSKEMDHHHHHHHQIQQHNQLLYHQQNNNLISFGMMQSSSSSSSDIPVGSLNVNNDGGASDLGELDRALFLYLHGQDHQSAQNSGTTPHTLNIFPSQPMHVEPSATASMASSSGLVNSLATSGSKRSSEPSIELSNPRIDVDSVPAPAKAAKTLRRLAQNREAAKKSRLRKKTYIQQLETSRVRLSQLEQEIQRSRSQGCYVGGNAIVEGGQVLSVANENANSDAVLFDMEYSRWLEEHHRLMVELRKAMHYHLPENELRVFVDNCLAHYDQMINLKNIIAKSDVFYFVSAMWKNPVERWLMWMGGFRPSELIKIILSQIEPLTEQQRMRICGLQQLTHEAEETLTQGLDALNRSLSQTLISDSLSITPNMNDYMSQMVVAIKKLSTIEGFVRQADNLRNQTLHRLHQILTTRQAAKCFLAMAEYFHRLRALSSLWLSRPRQE